MRWLVPSLLLALLAWPRPARAGSLAGTWLLPVGVTQLTETPDGIVGRLVQPSPDCPALAKGAEVLHGSELAGTISGELRLCLEGPDCTAKESWLSALLMADPHGQKLSGAVERGNAACHAKLPGKGGVVLRKVVPGQKPHPDARAKLNPQAVAKAQALLAEGQRYLEAGEPEQARERFQAAAQVAPLPEAFNGIGVTHYFRRDFVAALAAYQESIAADPDFGDAYYNMACLYAVDGKRDLAFKFLRLSARNRYHDFSHLDDDPDLQSLRSDPRYAELKKLAAREK